jgi:hypothetical protein
MVLSLTMITIQRESLEFILDGAGHSGLASGVTHLDRQWHVTVPAVFDR